jgi:hypothetical protein
MGTILCTLRQQFPKCQIGHIKSYTCLENEYSWKGAPMFPQAQEKVFKTETSPS